MITNDDSGLNQSEVLKFLADTYARFGIYHNHKETSAWVAVALWFGAAITPVSSLLPNPAYLTNLGRSCLVLFIVTLGCLVWFYVATQLRQRSHAADVVAACGYLSVLIISGELDPKKTDFKARPPAFRDKKDWHYLPAFLLEAVEDASHQDTYVRRRLELLGYSLILVPGIAALLIVCWPWMKNLICGP